MTKSETSAPEVWKPVVGFEHYEVSSLGRVRSIRHLVKVRNRWGGFTMFNRGKGGVLRPCHHKNGYLSVTLYSNTTGQCRRLISRLVFEAFVRLLKTGEEADHKDRVRHNNALENPRPLTVAANRALRVPKRGEECHYAKLTDAKVRRIRAMNGTQRHIASKFDVCQATVANIQSGKSWSHLT